MSIIQTRLLRDRHQRNVDAALPYQETLRKQRKAR